MRPLIVEPHMKKWLLIEAGVLTFPSIALMAYAIPMLAVGLIQVVFPFSTDGRTFLERAISLLPYVGGVFGLLTLWRCVVAISQERKFILGLAFWVAILAGISACRELFAIAPTHISYLVSVPVWVLVVQVIFMNEALKPRQK
jgi:hypothetical protein